ncbi:hypothetical protein [Streptomyces inusitatus]|nr:hypothetical protein [Streptomyces inusitatus]
MTEQLADETKALQALHQAVRGQQGLEELQSEAAGLRTENRALREQQKHLLGELTAARSDIGVLHGDIAERLRDLVDAADRVPRPGSACQSPGLPGPGPGADRTEATAGAQASDAPEPDPQPAAAPPSDEPEEEPMEPMERSAAEQPAEAAPDSGSDPDAAARDAAEQEAALKRAVEAAYRGEGPPPPPAVPPVVPPGQGGEGAGGGKPEVEHGKLLMRAAGISTAKLYCHRDTWEFLTGLAVAHDHFRAPPSVDNIKKGRIRTALSGRSLIALLIVLWTTRDDRPALGADWALAATVYNRIAGELNTVTAGPGRKTIEIVLDDGTAPDPADPAQEPPSRPERP